MLEKKRNSGQPLRRSLSNCSWKSAWSPLAGRTASALQTLQAITFAHTMSAMSAP